MLDKESGIASGFFKKILMTVSIKKGSQQIVKALIIMPRVVLAFLSFANCKRRRFCLWGEFTSLQVLLACLRSLLFNWREELYVNDGVGVVVVDVIEAVPNIGCFSAHGCNIGHWDSLLLRGPPEKHLAACTLHWKNQNNSFFNHFKRSS